MLECILGCARLSDPPRGHALGRGGAGRGEFRSSKKRRKGRGMCRRLARGDDGTTTVQRRQLFRRQSTDGNHDNRTPTRVVKLKCPCARISCLCPNESKYPRLRSGHETECVSLGRRQQYHGDIINIINIILRFQCFVHIDFMTLRRSSSFSSFFCSPYFPNQIFK
jgi:hypothetical protein